MTEAVVLLGSNLGDREASLALARGQLAALGALQASSLYRSAPWGKTDQPEFLNQALIMNTPLSLDDFFAQTRQIEKSVGTLAARDRSMKWGPRSIDIDLLFFGDIVRHTAFLTVPHPRLHERRFTLVPLLELIPGFRHPVLGATVRELLDRCPDQLEVQLLTPGWQPLPGEKFS